MAHAPQPPTASVDGSKRRQHTAEDLLASLALDGLDDGARLVVMRQNPSDNYHWSKPVGEFSVRHVRNAIAKAEGQS